MDEIECYRTADMAEARTKLINLFVPDLLQHDFLHHFHLNMKLAHQGVKLTYQKIHSSFRCTVLPNDMWANVLILWLEKVVQTFEGNFQEMYKQLIFSE